MTTEDFAEEVEVAVEEEFIDEEAEAAEAAALGLCEEEVEEAFEEAEPEVQDEEEEEPPAEEDEEPDETDELPEHLRDSMEGNLRLKRLLSRDAAGTDGKKRKLDVADPECELLCKQLQTKWGLIGCFITTHVLSGLKLTELNELKASGWAPSKFDERKTPAELLSVKAAQLRERKGSGGGALDNVAVFRHYWSIGQDKDKLLRGLCHKDLRHVLEKYDGETPLEDCITEAAQTAPDEEFATGAMPDGPGAVVVGRFLRLELIDPMADAAVFGDANLTFSIKLAQHRKALGHVGRVIATTFEDLDTLKQRYTEILDTVKVLEDHYAEVFHGVDCTRIGVDTRFGGMEESIGAVYYNFPHAGAVGGFFDGHPLVNWRHENLMRLFFRALRTYVKPGGQVKVSSNSGAMGVRYSYIVDSAKDNEFVHSETVPFTQWHLHRYGRSYGDKRDVYKRPDAKNNQSYNAQRADSDMVYCFTYKPSGEALAKQEVRLPPTLNTLMACQDGPFKALQGESRKKLANDFFKRFVTEISGTHVG